jgi:hypothetical protein
MFEDISVELIADFVEVIHVQLAHEGGEVAVPKVGRQDLLFEALHIEDGEVSAIIAPCHNPRMLVALNRK